MTPDPFLLEIDAEAADSVVGRAEKIRDHPADKRFTEWKQGHYSKSRAPEAAHKLWEGACRQSWRAMLLVIKAKLEAIEAGISVFEDEFLAHIVMPDGRTISEHVRPQLDQIAASGTVQRLLPDYSRESAP